jgi:Fe-S-cluster-containing hydrogenase component 2
MTNRITRDNRTVVADSSLCAGCIICMLRCSFREGSKFNLSKSHITVERLVGRANEFDITFTDGCDACLICAIHCPYGALTSSKTGKED